MEKALIEKGIMPKLAKADKEDEEEEEKEDKKKISKSIEDVAQLIKEKNFSVGVILKGVYDELNAVKSLVSSIKEENTELKKALDESKESFGTFDSKISDLTKALDEPAIGRKSVQISTNARERNIGGNQQDISKANNTGNAVSMNERKKVLEILDKVTFEKGCDNEFAEAMTTYESIGKLSPHILQRLASEKGITIK